MTKKFFVNQNRINKLFGSVFVFEPYLVLDPRRKVKQKLILFNFEFPSIDLIKFDFDTICEKSAKINEMKYFNKLIVEFPIETSAFFHMKMHVD